MLIKLYGIYLYRQLQCIHDNKYRNHFHLVDRHLIQTEELLASENEFTVIIFIYLVGGNTFSCDFIVKCAAKIFKISRQIKFLCPKIFWKRGFWREN